MSDTDLSLANLIASEDDLAPEPVATPEWRNVDGRLYVRRLTTPEWLTLLDALDGPAKAADEKALLVQTAIACTCDSAGKRVFRPDHATMLATQKSATALKRIFEQADRLNFLSAKTAAELSKNSAGGSAPASSST
jgi:hypothetical protein